MLYYPASYTQTSGSSRLYNLTFHTIRCDPLQPKQAISMTITIARMTPALGAIVDGIRLADELPQQSIDRLGELLVEHQILFFRRQPLTPQQQCRFAKRFGELHIHPIYPVLPELPEIMVIDTHEGFLPDNDNWHTDVTFSPTPPLAGILAAKQLPSVGGDTLWSSNLAAYEALSGPLQAPAGGLDGRTFGGQVLPGRPLGRGSRASRSVTTVRWRNIHR